MRYIKPYELLSMQVPQEAMLTIDTKEAKYIFKYTDWPIKATDRGTIYRLFPCNSFVATLRKCGFKEDLKGHLISRQIFIEIKKGQQTLVRFSTPDEIETYNEILKKTRMPF